MVLVFKSPGNVVMFCVHNLKLWSNFQHGRVDRVLSGIERVNNFKLVSLVEMKTHKDPPYPNEHYTVIIL